MIRMIFSIKDLLMMIQQTKLRNEGFSLIEVIMAIGIFMVTVLALVGLLGPTLKSVDEIEKTDELASVVNTINAFLQNSPDIAPGDSKFDAIYEAVSQDYATLLVFRAYDDNDVISLKIGFVGETAATLSASDVTSGTQILAAGPVYRAVLTTSSVNPSSEMVDAGADAYPRYTMNATDPSAYTEGAFAMEVQVFVAEPSLNFDPGKLPPYGTDALDATPENLSAIEPIFTYNTAIVR
jgi:Tfp pilus assembly protein PilV